MDKNLIREIAALNVRIMDLEAQIRAAHIIIKTLTKERAKREIGNAKRNTIR
jgi:hypothetical protein